MRVFFVLCILLASCSPKGPSSSWFEKNGKVKVLSTTAMIDDLVGKVGKDRIDHLVLIRGEIDPHSYNIVKGDDEKISHAQLIFANGLNLEHGASLRYQLEHHSDVVFLGEEINRQVPDRIIKIGNEIDPHIWMDISLWAEGVDAIVQALSEKDPDGRQFYEENGAALYKEMLETHQRIKGQLEEIPSEKRHLVTSHDAFNYFTWAYLGADWKERCIAPEGLAPEGQISSTDIQRVVEYICRYHVEVVFPESNVSRDALKKITTACGRTIRVSKKPLYGDAMGAETYLKMIEHDAMVLIDEWKK